MKIAKKVLAVVMAIAMIGCLTAMAFAEPVGKFVLTVEKDPEDPTVAIATLYAKDAIGFKAGNVHIAYDPAVLEYSYAELGKDAAEVNDNCIASKNGYTGLDNGETEGLVDYGFYFTETLGTLDEFKTQAKKKTYNFGFDPNNFECAVFFFNIIDDKATETKLELTGDGDVKEAKGATLVINEAPETTTEKKEEPTSKKKEEPTSKKADESTTKIVVEPTSKKANPGKQGDVNTGDNMALAGAAGVVALAGAAFIISKKRK